MTHPVRHCVITWAADRIEAWLDGNILSATRPAELWMQLAATLGQDVALLLGHGMAVNGAAVDTAVKRMQSDGLGAMVGRVRDDAGRTTAPLSRIEALRHLDPQPGALLVRGTALATVANRLGRPPDPFWAHDLANALRAIGAVGTCGEVLATGGSVTAGRMGPVRAALLEPLAPESLIVVYGLPQASVSLYFDGLPADLARRLRFLAPGDLWSDVGWLASAGLVLVVRGFEHMLHSGALALLEELGVPYAWFTDDDLGRLSTEAPGMSFYRPEALRRFTEGATAIVTTSPALAEALSPLHPRIIRWPLVYDRALGDARPPAAPMFRAGVFGGSFRHASFRDHVLPAMGALGVPVVAGSDIARNTAGLDVTPFQPSLARFVADWRRRGLRVLAHPYGESSNIASKGPASLLVAAYLGCVAVVADEPAHAGLGEAEGVVVAGRDPADWLNKLRPLADADTAATFAARLDAWCRRSFDPERARASFAELAALALPGGLVAGEARWQAAMQSRTVRAALPPRSAFGRQVEALRRSLRRRLSGR